MCLLSSVYLADHVKLCTHKLRHIDLKTYAQYSEAPTVCFDSISDFGYLLPLYDFNDIQMLETCERMSSTCQTKNRLITIRANFFFHNIDTLVADCEFLYINEAIRDGKFRPDTSQSLLSCFFLSLNRMRIKSRSQKHSKQIQMKKFQFVIISILCVRM